MATKKEIAEHKRALKKAHSKLYRGENKLICQLVTTTGGKNITKEQLSNYYKGNFAGINQTSVKILEETLKIVKGR